MALHIYLVMEGGWWSFTPKQFLLMVSRYIKTNDYPDVYAYGKTLSHPPYKNVGRYHEHGSYGNWFSASPDIVLYNPLDWGRDEYIGAFDEIYNRIITTVRDDWYKMPFRMFFFQDESAFTKEFANDIVKRLVRRGCPSQVLQIVDKGETWFNIMYKSKQCGEDIHDDIVDEMKKEMWEREFEQRNQKQRAAELTQKRDDEEDARVPIPANAMSEAERNAYWGEYGSASGYLLKQIERADIRGFKSSRLRGVTGIIYGELKDDTGRTVLNVDYKLPFNYLSTRKEDVPGIIGVLRSKVDKDWEILDFGRRKR